MRAILVLLVIVVVVAIAAISLGFVNVSQTKQASLPTIKVEGGQAPAYDVQTANVSVTNEQKTVNVPHLNVEKPQ
jgi:predicted S18 family serine protease